MADHVITISNTLTFFGPAGTNKWGEMTWGEDLWGENTEFPQDVGKYIGNSITPSDSIARKDVIKVYSTDLSVDSETTSETLQDGSGYYYEFVKPTTEAEQRATTVWTSSTVA